MSAVRPNRKNRPETGRAAAERRLERTPAIVHLRRMTSMLAASAKRVLSAALIAGTLCSASVAIAQPYPPPPPGWAGPHYYWHHHHWHHRHWEFDRFHRHYWRYY